MCAGAGLAQCDARRQRKNRTSSGAVPDPLLAAAAMGAISGDIAINRKQAGQPSGRSNMSAACMTFSYLCGSVESLLAGWKSRRSTSWSFTPQQSYRAFRSGASNRILKIAMDQKRKLLQSGSGARELVHIGNAVAEEMYSKLKFTSHRSGYSVGWDRDAYEAGFREGVRVDLHGARKNRMLT
jgi:hypothetical protein